MSLLLSLFGNPRRWRNLNVVHPRNPFCMSSKPKKYRPAILARFEGRNWADTCTGQDTTSYATKLLNL
jgi:hypothetical protein